MQILTVQDQWLDCWRYGEKQASTKAISSGDDQEGTGGRPFCLVPHFFLAPLRLEGGRAVHLQKETRAPSCNWRGPPKRAVEGAVKGSPGNGKLVGGASVGRALPVFPKTLIASTPKFLLAARVRWGVAYISLAAFVLVSTRRLFGKILTEVL